MKESSKRILTIEIIMLIVSILNFFFPFLFSNYKYIFFMIALLVITYFQMGMDLNKSVREKNVLKNILIILMIYFLLTYLFGLMIGFSRTIYKLNLSNLLKNIIPDLIFIFLCEILRFQLVRKANKNTKLIVLSAIAISIFEISINFIAFDLSYADGVYEFIGIGILSVICKNILLTILAKFADYVNAIFYRIVSEIYIYIVPIVPALGPYLTSVFNIILPILISITTINETRKKINEKPKNKNKANALASIVIVFLLILVGLNSGFFRYQTLVVGSNSMKNYMEKGDVILIKRLKTREKNSVEIGEILVFRYDNKVISHRVYDKEKRNNKVYYITKGDNNSQIDLTATEENHVIGLVKIRFKNLGLPSIWLSELFK